MDWTLTSAHRFSPRPLTWGACGTSPPLWCRRYLSEVEDLDLKEALEVLKHDSDAAAPGEAGAGARRTDDERWRKAFVRALNHFSHSDIAGIRKAVGEAICWGQLPLAAGADGHAALWCAGAGSVAPTNRTLGAESTISKGTAANDAKAKAAQDKLAALEEASRRKQTEPQWDSTSKVGDDTVGKMDRVEKGREAEEFLRQNPELKAVHSLSSAKALLETAPNLKV